jgi:hypothetical protein
VLPLARVSGTTALHIDGSPSAQRDLGREHEETAMGRARAPAGLRATDRFVVVWMTREYADDAVQPSEDHLSTSPRADALNLQPQRL